MFSRPLAAAAVPPSPRSVSDPVREKLQATFGSAYTLGRELGGGGMSRVFVAHEVSLGREVVVKVVAPELAEGVSAERFAREVKLAARLQQANIVPVLAAGVAAGTPYYTMPYVDGLSLRARMQSGPLPIGEAVSILRDLARALAYAHAQGVVHRDIKPENILLSGGAAVVTDFGIAKALSASRTIEASNDVRTDAGLTRAGMSLGTPAYMAPEQALGDPSTDHRADLYAWGVVAWELIAGAHPFAGRTTSHALIAAHVSDVPLALSVQRPDVPQSLAALVMRCLEKDPSRRPASASEVLSALDAIGTPSNAYAVERRRSGRWAIAGAALLVLASGVALVALRARHATPATPPAIAGATTKSLAVLPFASVGGDTANVYFAEGIADELTTALARLSGLRLAGRSSSARFKQRGASAQEIGAALSVSAVLDGTVRRAGNRIRVSTELTSAEDGRVLWSESYERELKDVFAVQDDITRAIVGALQVQLSGGKAPTEATSHGTTNLAAYDLYLRGLRLYRNRGPGLAQAERYLTQAIALDSNFAQAYATLASVLCVTPYYFARPIGTLLPRARAAAQRAVSLDPALPEAHAALGHVHTEAFEWPAAEAELHRAMALGPSNAEIPFRFGFMLLTSGRVHEAVVAFDQSKAIDPFYSVAAIYSAWSLALAGRDAEALAEAHRALELDPNNEAVNNIFGSVLMETGHLDQAVAHARKMVPRTTDVRRLGFYALILAQSGAKDDARVLLRRIDAMPDGTWGKLSSQSRIYLALGDTARALAAMEGAAAGDGDLMLAQIVSSPHLDPIRRNARFAAVMRRFNLDLARVTAPDGGRSR
ncbi:MAG: protein kinase [Gemmatimonadetes bacterium]|nr:protein kinase [Gemmatimonadota bacterium]